MPVALDIPWDEVRMLAVQIGIKPAAEKLGIMQHLDALYQRSKREGWMANVPRSTPLPPTVLQPVSLVSSPANAQVQALRDKVIRTRLNHIQASLVASEEIVRLDPQSMLLPEVADVMLKHAKHAATAGGWNADTRADSPGKAFGARQMGLEIDVEADSVVGDVEVDPTEGHRSAGTGHE